MIKMKNKALEEKRKNIEKIEIETPLKEIEKKGYLRDRANISVIKTNTEATKNLIRGWQSDKQAYNFGGNDFGLKVLNTGKNFEMTIVNTTIDDLNGVIRASTMAMANLKQTIGKIYFALLILISKYPDQFKTDCTIQFETKQIAEILGVKDTDDFRRELLRYLKIINFTTISTAKGQTAMQIGGGFYSVSRRKGTASFQFQNKFFNVMRQTGFVMAVPYEILQTDANKNPTAFRIGLDFILQKRLNIGTEGTAKKKRQNNVAVKTLYDDLVSTKEITPYNPKTGKFKTRFRPNFEKGLNYYIGKLFKSWKYKDKKTINTFEEWIKNTIIVEYTDEMEEILTKEILEAQQEYFEKMQNEESRNIVRATAQLLKSGDTKTQEKLKDIIKEEAKKQIEPHTKKIKKLAKQIENQTEMFDDFIHGTQE